MRLSRSLSVVALAFALAPVAAHAQAPAPVVVAPPPGGAVYVYPPPPPCAFPCQPTRVAYAPVATTWQVAPAPGYHTHDGFFLRLQLGVGGLAWGAENAADDYTVAGGAGTFRVAMGTAMSRNAVLYGEVFADTATDPHVSRNGESHQAKGSSTSAVGIGPGIALYSDSNFFISGSWQIYQLQVDLTDGKDATQTVWESGVGTGWSFAVGKEWWISHDWGVGLAGTVFVGSARDKADSSLRWTTASAMLALSATYN